MMKDSPHPAMCYHIEVFQLFTIHSLLPYHSFCLKSPLAQILDSMTRMLTELQWPTLQTLRYNATLILLYKLIHHHQLIPNQYLPFPAYPITRANHHFKFQHYTSRTTMYHNSFCSGTIPEWNKLPSAIAESDDLNLFKHNLSNYNA